jgi:hypothetical protein
MKESTVPGVYTPDLLLRYVPAGHSHHLDPDGRVREAPPFEKVCEDWTGVVTGLGLLLEGAAAAGACEGENGSGGSGESTPTVRSSPTAAVGAKGLWEEVGQLLSGVACDEESSTAEVLERGEWGYTCFFVFSCYFEGCFLEVERLPLCTVL